jgi:hypothetical protein
MTDANGAANFTQQFAVNGQRGSATAFALDGFDTTDPELGGATFSNFNVDAIQEVRNNSGVMPAEWISATDFSKASTRPAAQSLDHSAIFISSNRIWVSSTNPTLSSGAWKFA